MARTNDLLVVHMTYSVEATLVEDYNSLANSELFCNSLIRNFEEVLLLPKEKQMKLEQCESCDRVGCVQFRYSISVSLSCFKVAKPLDHIPQFW